jgi:hypothetical protein
VAGLDGEVVEVGVVVDQDRGDRLGLGLPAIRDLVEARAPEVPA